MMIIFNLNMKITLLVAIFAISVNVSSQSVGVDNNNDLESTFTAKNLSNYKLRGFETRAVQKLEDFGDYLELISNKEFDLGLRKQAIKMLENLFIDKNALLVNPENELTDKNQIEIREYAQSVLECDFSRLEISITKIKLSKPLEFIKKGNYSGELSFTQSSKFYKSSKVLKRSLRNRKARIVVVKTSKKFGNEKEFVWNVLLVNIN